MEFGLAISGTAAALVLVAFVAAWPWFTAAARRRRTPRPVFARPGPVMAALVMVSGIGAGLWLALESASPGGVLQQRPLLEQLVPFLVAVMLATCLTMLPWRPLWVARELRRLAIVLPVVSAAVLLVDGAMTGYGIMALVGTYLGVSLAAASGLLVVGRMLESDVLGQIVTG